MFRMVKLHHLIFVLIFMLLNINIPGLKAESMDKIIAIVNQEVVTKSELEEVLSIMAMDIKTESEQERQQAMDQLSKEILNRLIEDKLIISEAKKAGVVVEDFEIEARLNEIKKNFPSENDFYDYIHSRGMTVGDIKRKLEEQIMVSNMMQYAVRDKVSVEPREITDYYEFHQDEFVRPEERDVQSIFIYKEGLSDRDYSKKIDSVLGRIRQEEDFQDLRKEFSEREDLGVVAKGTLIEEVDKVIFSLKEGEVSEPTQVDKGCYIFKIKKIIPEKKLDLVEAQDDIHSIIFNEKAEELFTKWLDGLKGKAYIEIK